MRFVLDAEVSLFAESVAGAIGDWRGLLEPEFGTWWDERDDELAGRLRELGWDALWEDAGLLPMVVAGAIELGRVAAPLSLIDEATLGAPLGLGSRVRHGEDAPTCASLSADGNLVLTGFTIAGREPTLDGTGTVTVALGAAVVVADGSTRLRTWVAATLGYLAGLTGAAAAAAVSHARSREQFGAPLGALPAVQGRLAEIALARDGLELAAWGATDPARVTAVDELAWAVRACREATGQVIQVHGGIGFALEGGVHRFYRRAKTVQVWTEELLRDLPPMTSCG